MSEKVQSHTFEPDPSGIPNSRLPLLVYPRALPEALRDPEAAIALFRSHAWGNNWVNGVFDYWHFHVTGHEALGCVAGEAEIGFGGDRGVTVTFRAGDVVVIPAGVGHKRLSAKRGGFTVIGGYPPGQSGRISEPGDFAAGEAERLIASLDLPASDPVEGRGGALVQKWRA